MMASVALATKVGVLSVAALVAAQSPARYSMQSMISRRQIGQI